MKLLVVQTVLPPYRKPVFSELLSGQFEARLAAGTIGYDDTISSDPALLNGAHRLANHFLAGRRLLWQSGLLRVGLGTDVLLIEMNPRAISTWAVVASRKVLHKPTVFWGHAWPRLGKASKTDRLRSIMRKLADVVVVYTDTQASELRRKEPKLRVFAAPNALYRLAGAEPVSASADRDAFVYVGRLAANKKSALLVSAFLKAKESLPAEARLVMAGAGPLASSLLNAVRSSPFAGSVEFVGEKFEYSGLNELYETAVASISPGYAGLSLTQSLWFGVPMIIADEEAHAPEIEAAESGINAFYFKAGSESSLARSLIEAWETRSELSQRAASISESARSKYSVEVMAGSLLEAAELAAHLHGVAVPSAKT